MKFYIDLLEEKVKKKKKGIEKVEYQAFKPAEL